MPPLLLPPGDKKKILAGQILIKDRTPSPHRPSTKVVTNDQVETVLYKTSHEDEYWQGKKLTLDTTPQVIHEDSDLIIVNKPPFMSTHPTGKHLFNCVTVYFQSRDQKGFHSVHRLDRETSGVLLLATNPESAARFTTMFEQGEVKKCYFFIAKNLDDTKDLNKDFEVNLRLSSDKRGFGKEKIYVQHHPADSEQGKSALTRFIILERNNHYTIGLAFPHTGRQHQIRVHAQASGIPLVGDKLYLGGYELFQRFKENEILDDDYQLMQLPRHALHATAINIPYPGKEQRTTYLAPIPHDLQQLMSNVIGINYGQVEMRIQQVIKQVF